MAPEKGKRPAGKSGSTREERLKAALKANLARRKAQSRARTQVADAQAGQPRDAGQEKDA